MKLSNETREVLKNFSGINPNLMVRAGNQLGTMSAMKNIVSVANVGEEFTRNFAIYDLNQFLSTLSLTNDPELEFDDTFLTIKDNKDNIVYRYSDESLMTKPKTDINMPDADVTFRLTSDDLTKIKNASSAMSVGDLVITVNDTTSSTIKVLDQKNSLSHVFSLDIDSQSDTGEGTFTIRVDNLKLLQGDYVVSLSSKGISKFEHTTRDLVYFIALES